METPLYFIAVIPPEEIRQEVTAFKEIARDRFQAERALNSPPHITLIPPFRWVDEQFFELEDLIHGFNAQLVAFPVQLNGFAAFPPRVIFVDIEPSAALETCQETLEHLCREQLGLRLDSPHGFHPHMTIAFKDLKRKHFPEAWAYFELLPYEASFWVREIHLLTFDEGRWKLVI